MQACDLMTGDVRTVSPDMRLIDLERFLVSERLTGAPVVRERKLVGVVSWSDVVRRIVVERTCAEYVADVDSTLASWHQVSDFEMLEQISEAVADHLEHLHVRDVMTTNVITIAPETEIRGAARLMIDKRVHRVLVVEAGEVRGVLSASDFVRVIADGRATV